MSHCGCHTQIGGWLYFTRPSTDGLPFCRLPSGSRIWKTKTRGVSLWHFCLGFSIHSSWTQSSRVPCASSETAVRFRGQYLTAQLDCNRRVRWPESPARPLVANLAWTDHTSIWCFSSRQVERSMYFRQRPHAYSSNPGSPRTVESGNQNHNPCETCVYPSSNCQNLHRDLVAFTRVDRLVIGP